MKPTPGINLRHSRECPQSPEYRKAHPGTSDDAPCRCTPAIEAFVYDRSTKRKIRRRFTGPGALTAAKEWRADAQGDVRRGRLRATPQPTIRDAADALIAGMRDGSIRTRSGRPYKPAIAVDYKRALDRFVDRFGPGTKLGTLTRPDLQAWTDELAKKLSPSSVRNHVNAVRVLYRRAIVRGELAVTPCVGLELPAVEGRRERVCSPDEAANLIAALDDADRALWATAFYGGLRRGELLALRIEDIDLTKRTIRVERGYCMKTRQIVSPKSKAGRRSVPIAAVLHDLLQEHLLLHVGRAEGLVFGTTAEQPFDPDTTQARADGRWSKAKPKLERVTLHDARHTAASMLIAAGVNAKTLTELMGHSSITTTYDRYGHLLPGAEDETRTLLDRFLEKAAA